MSVKKLLFALFAFFYAASAEAQFPDQRQYAPFTNGTANAQTVSIPNYNFNVGVVLRFIPSVANTGPTTLAVSGTLAVAIEKFGSSGLLPLTGGELVPGQVSEVIFDGVQYELLTSSIVNTEFTVVPLVAGIANLAIAVNHVGYISGAGGLVSFGSGGSLSNPFYLVQFSGGQTLAYSSQLILPGGGSEFQVGAGDTAFVEYFGGSNWQVLSWSPATVLNGAYPGEVRIFAQVACPTNWAPLNGGAISRTGNAGLFGAIGTIYGSGDGSTTFNIPDARGLFVRDWAAAGSIDPGRAFGSTQALQVGAASGPITATSTSTSTSTSTFSAGTTTPSVATTTGGASALVPGSGVASAQAAVTGSVATTTTTSTTTTGSASTNAGNTDNRPVNIAFEMCIKL